TRLSDGRLSQGHSCVAAYPLGEPWRARLFMTPLLVTLPPDYLRGILAACVQDAMQASDPIEQLQRFSIQLSIRLIWLERAFPATFETSQSVPAVTATLTDVTIPVADGNPFALWQINWEFVAKIAACVLGAVVLLLVTFLALRGWLIRRERNSVWILPEAPSTPHLGGAHCGHGGAWIRYQ
ncbi:MAG: hypothetical protein ACOYMN_06025, partial [Roseimicrobium sp.]